MTQKCDFVYKVNATSSLINSYENVLLSVAEINFF